MYCLILYALPGCFALSVNNVAFDLKDGLAGATIELNMKRKVPEAKYGVIMVGVGK